MGKVYSNGLLNIAATSSTDGEGGFFTERPSKLPLESTACYISSSWTDHSNSNLHIHPSYIPSGMLLDGPLLSRGWVLQERIMAKRILHFGKTQLYWECNEHDCCEIYSTGIPDLWTRPTNGRVFKNNIPDPFIKYCSNLGVGTTTNSDTVNANITQIPSDIAASLRPSTLAGYPLASTSSPTSAVFQTLATEFWDASPSQGEIFWENLRSGEQEESFERGIESQMQLIDFWNCIVFIYSRCELTFERDKLVALAGVARAMKVQMACDYLAGMWRIELERNLLWSVHGKVRRPREYRAPSWSWVSIDGGIDFPGRRSEIKSKFEIEILYASTQKKSAEEMGQVAGGALTVRGPLMTCFVKKTENFGGDLPREYVDHYDPEIDSVDPPEWFFRINGVWTGGSSSMDADKPFDTLLKTELHCLPILQEEGLRSSSYDCLVLERTKKRGVFRRCGRLIIDTPWHGISADKGWIVESYWTNSVEIIQNEEWFDGGEADSEGKYTITII